MPCFRSAARFAAILLAAAVAAAPAHAATLTVDIPGCTALTLTGTSPNFQVSCTQQNQACIVNATPANPQANTQAQLTAACTPTAASVTWQASRDCNVPAVTTPLSAAVTESSGRSCVYTATADGGGSGAAMVVWQGPGTAPPPNAPTGCSITRTPSNGSMPTAGGAIGMSASCTGGGAVTSWSWRKNAATGWSTNQAPTDNLPANAGGSLLTYTYGVTACAGTACATEVITTFTVAGAQIAGFCGQYSNVVIVDIPIGGTVDTAANGGFLADGVFVGRLAIPANVNQGGTGQVRFVELVDSPAQRQMTVSPQPCDFRGYVSGGGSSTDPTGTSFPIMWSNDQQPSILYRFTQQFGSATLQAGQTYYFSIRNVDFSSGVPSCQTTTCNGRFQMTTP